MIVKNKMQTTPPQYAQQAKANYSVSQVPPLSSMAMNDSFDNIIQKLRKELLQDIDKNGDGSISATELSNATHQAVTSANEREVFDRLDQNSDGKIDGQELAAVMTGEIYKNKKHVAQAAPAPQAAPSPLQNILAAQSTPPPSIPSAPMPQAAPTAPAPQVAQAASAPQAEQAAPSAVESAPFYQAQNSVMTPPKAATPTLANPGFGPKA